MEYPAGDSPTSIAAGGFAGDGELDLAVTSNGDEVSVLMGNGDGTFQPEVDYRAGTNLQSIVAGDFTGDGRLDLAVLDESDSGTPAGSIDVLLNIGGGVFQDPASGVTVSDPWLLAAADLTGDGRTDLISSDPSPGEMSVLLGQGDGTFQVAHQYGLGWDPNEFGIGLPVVSGDFNGDGRIDLAVLNGDGVVSLYGQRRRDVPAPDGVRAWQNTRSAWWPAISAATAGPSTWSSRTSMACRSCWATATARSSPQQRSRAVVASWWRAISTATATSTWPVPSFVPPRQPHYVYVSPGNGDGTFRPAVYTTVGIVNPYAIVAGDFNGNGKLDLVVAGTSESGTGEVAVLLGEGDGTFQSGSQYVLGPDLTPTSLVAGDFTGSGRLDLAITVQPINIDGAHPDQATSRSCSATETAPSRRRRMTPSDPARRGSSRGDFNSDGKLDLAVADSESNTMTILLGNGDGTFKDPDQQAITPNATPLVANVNGDGTADVLVVDGTGKILYRQGIPGQPGTFEPPVVVNPPLPDGSNPYTSRDIAWVPDTRDGPLLASVDARDNAVSLYAWRDGGFVRVGSLATGALPAQVIAADLDGTGFDDLIVRNAGDGTLSVFFNAEEPKSGGAAGPFLPAVPLAVGLGVSDVQAVYNPGDGRRDLVVTNKLTGQIGILPNWGITSSPPWSLMPPAPGCPRSIRPARPRSPAWKRRRASPPGR